MVVPPEKAVYDIGKRLSQTRLNKDSLLKLLKQAASALSELSQSLSLQSSIEPLSDSLVQHNLLQHKDNDVRLLVAVCFSEIIRVLAPDPPYSDDILKDIFELFISMFTQLADTASPYFPRRVKILEIVAGLKCCVLMLDIGAEDLILEMFNIFFSVARENHQQSLFQAMLSIMTHILEEKVSQPLLHLILRNLLKKEKGSPVGSTKLAVSIIQNCTEKLEPFVQSFLTSSILDRDAIGSELKEFYHEIIYEISQYAPQMLLAVIPTLAQELLTDQVDIRIKAVHLLGRLFSLSGRHVAQEYRQLFVEFLKRFSDKSAEVRISAVECAKACYVANPSGTEALEILTALEGRLLDFDDKVRIQAVNAICDVAKFNLRCIRPELMSQATERLRDKKFSVRKNAMQKLLELYRCYCIKCSEGLFAPSDHFEQIPCRILMLCYDKDYKDFRPQNMELVLAEDLFPVSLSVEERTSHWTTFFSFFTLPQMKALNSILSQKRRLQTEMQVYLDLRKNKENVMEEVNERFLSSFTKMSASFIDSSKAEENFQKLHQMKDNSIFKALLQLLDEETTFTSAQSIRDMFLKKIGRKHPDYEFLRILSSKCSYTIFCAEHVRYILLDILPKKNAGNKNMEASQIDLLMTVTSMFPSLLKGSEHHFQKLFSEEGDPSNEKLLQMLARVGPHTSIKLRDIYSSLEWLCLEGTRGQSKYSVSAIASLADSSDQLALSDLYKKLVGSLLTGQNIPTVLQSLGCIAQHSISTFEPRAEEITQYIVQNLFHTTNVLSNEQASFGDDSLCSASCKLKIYGLKMLVKRFLPHQGTPVRHQIGRLLNILLKLLQEGDISDDIISSENDRALIRFAAAKSVLQLSKKWDLHISPQIFHLAILMAKDPSSHVRKSLLDKIHKMLKEHAIPSRYACAFAMASLDCHGDVRADSMKYLADFIMNYGQEARIRQTSAVRDSGGTGTNYPEYIVVFLIHVLAHDLGFPSNNCQDEDLYARFCSPLVAILKALISPCSADNNKNQANETISYTLSILCAIKKAEDAVDVRMTPKLHILSDIGVLTVKALSSSSICSSHTPGPVLLPSSFYKVSYDTASEEENLNYLTGCSIDEGFIGRILHMFELEIAQPTSLHSKQSRKIQEEVTNSDVIKHNTKNSALQNQSCPLMGKIDEGRDNSNVNEKELHKVERQQVGTRRKNKRALSPTAFRSLEILHECSAVSENKNSNAKSGSAKDQNSSCGSVITKPSLSGSQASSKGLESINFISMRKNGKKASNCVDPTEPIEITDTSLETQCKSKDLANRTAALVGHQIRLWSPVDKCFYSGIVSEYDSQNSTHQITYDNGDVERLHLENENWEVISNSSMIEKDTSKFSFEDRERQQRILFDALKHSKRKQAGSSTCQKPGVRSSISNLKEDDDKNAQRQTTFSDRGEKGSVPSVTGANKGRKGPKPSLSTNTGSGSEVLNEKVVRRTRLRKV